MIRKTMERSSFFAWRQGSALSNAHKGRDQLERVRD